MDPDGSIPGSVLHHWMNDTCYRLHQPAPNISAVKFSSDISSILGETCDLELFVTAVERDLIIDNITTSFDNFINAICYDRPMQDIPCLRSPHCSSIAGSILHHRVNDTCHRLHQPAPNISAVKLSSDISSILGKTFNMEFSVSIVERDLFHQM